MRVCATREPCAVSARTVEQFRASFVDVCALGLGKLLGSTTVDYCIEFKLPQLN